MFIFVDCCDGDDLISTKILPGLVTLSSDPDAKVQKSAIEGLGSVMCIGLGSGFYSVTGSSGGRISNETREKACFQLSSKLTFDANEKKHHEVLLEIVTTIGQVVNQAANDDLHFMSLRDEVLIPKLCTVFEIYTTPEFSEAKILETANALLAIYRSLLNQQKLPSQVYQNHVHPSLVKLGKEYHRMGIVAQETSTLQLLGQLETSKGPVHSPSMEEMKNKVGKLFTRPSGSFWSSKKQ